MSQPRPAATMSPRKPTTQAKPLWASTALATPAKQASQTRAANKAEKQSKQIGGMGDIRGFIRKRPAGCGEGDDDDGEHEYEGDPIEETQESIGAEQEGEQSAEVPPTKHRKTSHPQAPAPPTQAPAPPTVTKQQRHVFDRAFKNGEMDREVADKFAQLKKDEKPGKPARIAELINAVVPVDAGYGYKAPLLRAHPKFRKIAKKLHALIHPSKLTRNFAWLLRNHIHFLTPASSVEWHPKVQWGSSAVVQQFRSVSQTDEHKVQVRGRGLTEVEAIFGAGDLQRGRENVRIALQNKELIKVGNQYFDKTEFASQITQHASGQTIAQEHDKLEDAPQIAALMASSPFERTAISFDAFSKWTTSGPLALEDSLTDSMSDAAYEHLQTAHTCMQKVISSIQQKAVQVKRTGSAESKGFADGAVALVKAIENGEFNKLYLVMLDADATGSLARDAVKAAMQPFSKLVQKEKELSALLKTTGKGADENGFEENDDDGGEDPFAAFAKGRGRGTPKAKGKSRGRGQ